MAAITSKSLVSDEEIRKVLQTDKGEEAQLKSWKYVDFTKPGDNVTTVISSVPVKYSSGGRESDAVYVVKLNPRRGVDVSKELTNMSFVKEVKFYSEVLPELNALLEAAGEEPLRFPRYFLGSLEMRKEYIFLEDLRQRGFRMFDRSKVMDVAHTTLVLKELARLSASSLLLQEKIQEPLEAKYKFLQHDLLTCIGNWKEILIPLLESSLTNTIQMLEKVGGYGKATDWINNMKPDLENILVNQQNNCKFNVLCHGDCWANNVMFRYNSAGEPEEVMLLDLQMCFKASPGYDLNYFLYLCHDGNVRRPNLSRFLSTYYVAFKKVVDAGGLAMPFTEDELLREFRDKNILGALYAMVVLPAVFIEDKDVPDMSTGDNDFEEFMKTLNEKTADSMETNPLVKPRFLDTFDEFMETGLIS